MAATLTGDTRFNFDIPGERPMGAYFLGPAFGYTLYIGPVGACRSGRSSDTYAFWAAEDVSGNKLDAHLTA